MKYYDNFINIFENFCRYLKRDDIFVQITINQNGSSQTPL